MKLLLTSTDTAMLMERSARLEASGIPTHLDDVAHVGVVPQHLYILLEEHYQDALAVLEDDSHPVANPVSADDLKEISDQARQEARVRRTRTLNRIAIVCTVVLFSGFLMVGVRAWIE
jgi:hypothetical protein